MPRGSMVKVRGASMPLSTISINGESYIVEERPSWRWRIVSWFKRTILRRRHELIGLVVATSDGKRFTITRRSR